MSSKKGRGVVFPTKTKSRQNSSDGRRPSFSDAGEEVALTGSPTALRSSQSLENIKEQEPPAAVPSSTVSEYEKKKANFVTRTLWTFVMIGGFFFALFMGHIYVILIITAIQIVSFKEVIAIANVPSKARDLRFTKALNWYFLASTMYFLYGESVIYYFRHIIFFDRALQVMATHHRFISFTIHVFGFVFFVGTLKKDHLKFQFSQFAWTHMALFLINVQAHFIMNNVFEGMIWFFLPAALVITNDIFAYICGITFGRTQLIKLSPKKTVEGFVGAWFMTVLFGIFLTNILMRSKYFICPASNLGATVFAGAECEPASVFIPRTYSTPDFWFLPPGYHVSLTIAPMQIHTFFWATFASLIAPFGGFFASGLKRTFKIKDFGDSIPGHGGVTDRMDCQFIMGMFAYLYYQAFIATHKTSLGEVVSGAISLSVGDQLYLIRQMIKYLADQGVFTAEVSPNTCKSMTARWCH
ncbi:cytidylyltransferase family-domain-containing protein [Cladorrhinum sp. PSN332]|nr:cytidylyltransferase family-domain-containing protein [Cladorrhinum sp. PSN332]